MKKTKLYGVAQKSCGRDFGVVGNDLITTSRPRALRWAKEKREDFKGCRSTFRVVALPKNDGSYKRYDEYQRLDESRSSTEE